MAGKSGAVSDRVVSPLDDPRFREFVENTGGKLCFQHNIHTLCVGRSQADKHLDVESLIKDPNLRGPQNRDGSLDICKVDDRVVYLALHDAEAIRILDPHYK